MSSRSQGYLFKYWLELAVVKYVSSLFFFVVHHLSSCLIFACMCLYKVICLNSYIITYPYLLFSPNKLFFHEYIFWKMYLLGNYLFYNLFWLLSLSAVSCYNLAFSLFTKNIKSVLAENDNGNVLWKSWFSNLGLLDARIGGKENFRIFCNIFWIEKPR